MEPNQMPGEAPKEKTSYGVLVALILIVAIIVGGAYYLFKERLEMPANTDATVEELQTQSESTEPGAIEADLNAQTPDDFGAELDAAFSDMEKSFEQQ